MELDDDTEEREMLIDRMGRETRIGLLVGLGFILIFAYLLGKSTTQPVYFPTSAESFHDQF